MKTFRTVLANTLVASFTNLFVWFAVTFWLYLETKSVLATSVVAGVYLATVAVSGIFLGSLVDRFKKRRVLLLSSASTLVLFALAALVYAATPTEQFRDPSSAILWIFIVLNLVGAIAGNIRSIAISTLVTILVPVGERDKANGLVGTANGVAFVFTFIFSGLVIGYLGMGWMLVIALAMTALVLAHLATIRIDEPGIVHLEDQLQRIDLPGTIRVVSLVPGLFGLIAFSTFNNFLGGVLMALMDAYGLSLVSVQVWGTLWGFLSLGSIVGGLVIARVGLGRDPLRTLFLANMALWTICMFLTIQSWIALLGAGMFLFLCLMPAVEASEQTILQKVIPLDRQGRVFGFAQSIEQAAAALTAIIIGPIAEFVFIPFMTTGAGAELIGPWYGTGIDRGIGLLFSVAGLIGLVTTMLAMRTRTFATLSGHYARNGSSVVAGAAMGNVPVD